ncbi:hypothetical protein GCK32_002362 [Trichostrongylus colubriformis]|uniref:Uncharacterized protein n=1 Tax=Trichostrongylus colubriformis TaxID=6319 RepID=A0AAN8FRF5_TRICO
MVLERAVACRAHPRVNSWRRLPVCMAALQDWLAVSRRFIVMTVNLSCDFHNCILTIYSLILGGSPFLIYLYSIWLLINQFRLLFIVRAILFIPCHCDFLTMLCHKALYNPGALSCIEICFKKSINIF